MKIGIYSPYIPKQLGGGEKYIFDVARMCVELGHSVWILLNEEPSSDIVSKYEKFLGVSLAGVTFVNSPIGSSQSFLTKLKETTKYDVLYLLTDGSFFFSLAHKNIAHIQIPFTDKKTALTERFKLKNWSIKNANSQFTKNIVEKAWDTPVQFVHYPMIDLLHAKYDEDKKEKIILSVGRFFDHLHSKRQDVMVEAFRKLIENYPKESKGWKLVLIGPAEDPDFAAKIKELAKGLPIEIIHDASREILDQYYAKATFYWHAAGYEVDEILSPEKVEHFGISTVESMNYGCIPVVVGKGGQVEVLGSELTELLWQKEEELVEITASLIKDKSRRDELSQKVIAQSKSFNKQKFVETLKEMLK